MNRKIGQIANQMVVELFFKIKDKVKEKRKKKKKSVSETKNK